jgi:ABC-type amino acid transport substrate-binding protein
MKKVLKITSLLLVVLFASSVFTSCMQKPKEELTTTETTETSEVVSTTEEVSETEKDTLTVSLGISFDYIPYKYKDGEKLNGINIDFMNAVADKLGMKVEFKEVDAHSSHYDPENFDIYINQTNSDTFDLQDAVFSKPYMSDTQSVIVKATTDYVVYDDF